MPMKQDIRHGDQVLDLATVSFFGILGVRRCSCHHSRVGQGNLRGGNSNVMLTAQAAEVAVQWTLNHEYIYCIIP